MVPGKLSVQMSNLGGDNMVGMAFEIRKKTIGILKAE